MKSNLSNLKTCRVWTVMSYFYSWFKAIWFPFDGSCQYFFQRCWSHGPLSQAKAVTWGGMCSKTLQASLTSSSPAGGGYCWLAHCCPLELSPGLSSHQKLTFLYLMTELLLWGIWESLTEQTESGIGRPLGEPGIDLCCLLWQLLALLLL